MIFEFHFHLTYKKNQHFLLQKNNFTAHEPSEIRTRVSHTVIKSPHFPNERVTKWTKGSLRGSCTFPQERETVHYEISSPEKIPWLRFCTKSKLAEFIILSPLKKTNEISPLFNQTFHFPPQKKSHLWN